MSCMIDDAEDKALLCYHKSADGRCMHFGPACETKPAAGQPDEKPAEPMMMPSTTEAMPDNSDLWAKAQQ